MVQTTGWTAFLVYFIWVSSTAAIGAEEVPALGPGRAIYLENEALVHQTHGVELLFNNTALDLINITEEKSVLITFFLDDPLPLGTQEVVLMEISPDAFGHISVSPSQWHVGEPTFAKALDGRWAGSFNLTGTFLGFSKIVFLLKDEDGEDLAATIMYDVRVQRSDRLWDFLFTIGMIILVAIAYINMGCVIDLEIVKRTIKKPVAPIIGLCSQYLFMPLASYGIGYALFNDYPPLWIGLFLIGCSPGGGASNIWTYLLGGSIDLSVTMTFVSTLVSFGALPLWVFALASTIFRDGNFSQLPFGQMVGMVVSLILPCAVGVLIRKYYPKVAAVLKRMLTPVAIIFVIFAITVGIYVNLYIFSYLTWKVAVAGFALPSLGFAFGMVVAILLRRKWDEVIAISVETGIQNTGLAIGVIKFSMNEYAPLGDITVVVPIAVAMFTPLPLLVFLIVKKVRPFFTKEESFESQMSGIDGPMHDEEQETGDNKHKMTPANSQTPLHKDSKASFTHGYLTAQPSSATNGN